MRERKAPAAAPAAGSRRAGGSVPPNVFVNPQIQTDRKRGKDDHPAGDQRQQDALERGSSRTRARRRAGTACARRSRRRRRTATSGRCATTNRKTAIDVLGELSLIAQIPASRPGRNEKPAWNDDAQQQGEGANRIERVQSVMGRHGGSDSVTGRVPYTKSGRRERIRTASHSAATAITSSNARMAAMSPVQTAAGPSRCADTDGSESRNGNEKVDRDVADGDHRRVPSRRVRRPPRPRGARSSTSGGTRAPSAETASCRSAVASHRSPHVAAAVRMHQGTTNAIALRDHLGRRVLRRSTPAGSG